MKKIVLLALLFVGNYGFSQGDTLNNFNMFKNEDSIKYLNNKNFKYSVLNKLFNKTINLTYLSPFDFSTQKYYASLTNENNEFSLQMNLNNYKTDTVKWNYIHGIGFNSKSSNDFATIYKNGKIQNDIYLNYKLAIFGKGKILFYQSQLDKYKKYRDEYLQKKYSSLLNKYIESEDLTLDILKDSITNLEFVSSYNSKKRLISEKFESLNSDNINDQSEAIIENKWYNILKNHSLVLNFNIPISESNYATADSIQTSTIRSNSFYPWKVNLKYTFTSLFNNKSVFFVSGRFNIFNDNNIENESITSADFLSFVNQGPNNYAVTETNTTYIGQFNRFITANLSGELTYLFKDFEKCLKGFKFGLSCSLEKSFGEIQSLNWKMGIPIILKDIDGEQTINLEILWKEENKDHFLGLRVGLPLGKFVNE